MINRIRLGKIFHDWKEKLDDLTSCIGQVGPTSGFTSAQSTESKHFNTSSKLSSTVGSTSPRSPLFAKANKKSKKIKNPEKLSGTLKVEENVQETIVADKEKGDEKEKEEQDDKAKEGHDEEAEEEEEEEEKDYSSMTLDELTSELQAWYYDLSYTLDGVNSYLTEEVRINFLTLYSL